jgi:hypothetical protein
VNQLEISFGTPLRIVVASEPPPPALEAWLTVRYMDFKIKAKGNIMYTLAVDHFVNMQISYVDSAGNPAEVDGDVNWRSSDTNIAKVEVDADDSTLVKVSPAGQGRLGQVQIVATADADLGAGTTALITTADVEIVAGEAVAGTITPVGEPEPIS